MPDERVGLALLDDGARAREALGRLAQVLGAEHVGEPDATGVFEVTVQADSFEAALDRVWDAVAAAGADDHVVFTEHPSLPEHFRRRQG